MKLKLPYRRARGDMIENYKILSNYNEETPPISKITTSCTRDSAFKLVKPRANKDVRKLSFTNKKVNLCNQLPNDVVKAQNMLDFEHRLDKFRSGCAFKYNVKADFPCHAHKHQSN